MMTKMTAMRPVTAMMALRILITAFGNLSAVSKQPAAFCTSMATPSLPQTSSSAYANLGGRAVALKEAAISPMSSSLRSFDFI